MRKNITYITGNNSYAVSRAIEAWVKRFSSTYGSENIERISLDDRGGFLNIKNNILTTGLFSLKRLFILSGGIGKKIPSGKGGIEELLDTIIEDMPEDHFLLFHSISPKEEGLIGYYDEKSKRHIPGWLQKNGNVQEKNTVWDTEYWANEFENLDTKTVRYILSKYEDSEKSRNIYEKNPAIGHLIAHSLKMVSLLRESGIQNELDSSLIYSEGGYGDYALGDALLSERFDDALEIFRSEAERVKSREILAPFLGSLRNALYIKYLASFGKTSSEIAAIIPIHPYPLGKIFSSKISSRKLTALYTKLVAIDRAYKSGKGLQDDELGRIFSIELALLDLKKENFMYNIPRNL